MKKEISVFWVTVWVLVVTAFAWHPAVSAGEPMTLGMIGSRPSRLIQRFTPLVGYLSTRGVAVDKVVIARSLEEMAEKFRSGEADFVFESVYGALKLMDETGAVPVLIREKSGVKMYNSVIFVKKDSPVQALKDLNGKVIAFEDPASTSSFMLPRAILENAGLKLRESRKPVPGFVACYFSKNDDNTIAQVRLGRKVDAGGIKKSEVENKPEFRLLSPESAYVPRHVLVVRKGLPSDELRNVLLGMKDDPDAQDVLKSIRTGTGFSEFDGDPAAFMNTTVREALGL
ncbi:metal-binding protein [Desulfonema ishimotonii]|uniref:Metal-binding protein n=1 Tax=Desulfonema ishimotonii TaxID=45657 RepID=A0A401G1H4_9BACT|nr:phosphate/phosphite/phosphonate ABC transporter substrate-binding protein [Desulfonema ishimotonii]GBC63070.1 metal-binding protein [Desulfonema ishimotonii]